MAPSVVDVPTRTRFEVIFDVPGATVDPDDVVIEARFTSPSGAVVSTGGFASHGRFRVRFTPREPGLHPYVIRANGGAGVREVARGTVRASASSFPGFVTVDPKDRHRLVRDDGRPVYVLGENRINVYDPTWNFEQADARTYIARMASFGMTALRVFFFSDCKSETSINGRRIGCIEPRLGRFDEATADAFDAIFEAAERHGIDVIPVAFALGFTPGNETWKSWAHNPYNADLGGPAQRPADFFTSEKARAHAVRRLRYIADRWGASTRLLAVDLLNEPERDGPIPEAAWVPWAEAMSAEWRRLDPWRHLVTTGSVGLQSNIGESDERPWYASGDNDIVQWHLYGKEFDAPHALAVEMSRKVGEAYGFKKPVLCGAFAYGGEDRRTYDHTHNGIWSLLLSGAGALANTAPVSQLGSDEPMTRERGVHFQVLSGFLQGFGKTPLSRRQDVRVLQGNARAWSLASDDGSSRALWLLGGENGYGGAVAGVQIAVPSPPGHYELSWIDDTNGSVIGSATPLPNGAGEVVVTAPPFTRHVAGRLLRQ